MGTKTVDRFLSLADNNFVEEVNNDLNWFLSTEKVDRVLVFPPVSNYRRFLIHKCVETLGRPELATFSIGISDERRTVVCYREKLLSDEACAGPVMGLTKTDRENASISQSDMAGSPAQAQPPQEKIRSSTKPRRPDRAVYVPRALRNAENNPPEVPDSKNDSKKTNQHEPPKCPKSPKEKGTPKKLKNVPNIYTPPHLRHQKPQNQEAESETETETVPSVPNSDNSINISDSNIDIGGNFYIGDYFANGQLGFYTPNFFNNAEDHNSWRTNESDVNMALKESNIINKDYIYTNNKDSRDEDEVEKNELKRASQEINRSSKRIIKQSFHSDVLVISDPVEEEIREPTPEPVIEVEPEIKKEKPKLEAKVSLKREENDWDAVFDDSGECLDPSLLEELTSTVGKVKISKAKNNYEQYQTKGQVLFTGPYDETFAHVVEVYDFPSEFKTNDLLSVFSEFKETGFEIKWVDDTHALIVFSSAKIACEVLSAQRPLVRCRPLSAATLESRTKAKKCAEFLQPYRQRPETCTALARRLVSGALGVKLSTARQERAEEARLISAAREKKRQAALHKEAAWDGSLANQSVTETSN